MRKTLVAIAAAAALYTTPVQAEDNCDTISELAEMIMEYRQLGISKEKLLNVISTSIAEDIADEAYERHRYNVPVLQKRVAKEFGNEWALRCYRSPGMGE